jgi:hypothetical protein
MQSSGRCRKSSLERRGPHRDVDARMKASSSAVHKKEIDVANHDVSNPRHSEVDIMLMTDCGQSSLVHSAFK